MNVGYVRRHEAFTMPAKWILIRGVYDSDKGDEAFFMLKLPSWGYGYAINSDSEEWGQRLLCYRGRHGFEIRWFFPQHWTVS